MGSYNYILFQAFSVINLIGCLTAIARLYKHYGPEVYIHPKVKRYVMAMIACLFGYVFLQLNALIKDDTSEPWIVKIIGTMFFIKSIIFPTIAALLRPNNQTGI